MGQMGYKIHALLVILDPRRFVTRTCNGCPEFEIDGKDIPDEAFMHFVYLGRVYTCVQVRILSLWYTGIIVFIAQFAISYHQIHLHERASYSYLHSYEVCIPCRGNFLFIY